MPTSSQALHRRQRDAIVNVCMRVQYDWIDSKCSRGFTTITKIGNRFTEIYRASDCERGREIGNTGIGRHAIV